MSRGAAEVSLQESGSSRREDQEGLPAAAAVPLPTPTQSKDPAVLICPINKCSGSLKTDAKGYDSRTGLELLVCMACGHRGFRSREGVILLFRGGYEFKFSYGPSIQTLTVVLSSAAVNLWASHGVSDDQLAKLAAEWCLLCGNTKKQVHLGIPAEEFADFYLYYCRT